MMRRHRSLSARGYTLTAMKSGPRWRANANRRPDHKEAQLLMANENPTGNGSPVALVIPGHHVDFLRNALSACKEGIDGDLESLDRHPQRPRAERETAAYGRLLNALETSTIMPDEDVIRVLTELAEQTDASNDYQQVILEHRALCGMLAQMEEGQRSDG